MRSVLVLLVLLVFVFGVAPFVFSPIEPQTWEPGPNPGLTGEFAANTRLAGVELLMEGEGIGPEAVVCSEDGALYTGYEDGRIVRRNKNGQTEEIANTGGRPLGIKQDAAGRLIVADADRGLLAVTDDGEISVLTDSYAGERMIFVDDLDIAADGTIWFSDASTDYDIHHTMYNFLEGNQTGRLLSYDPSSGETSLHLEGMYFSNGVAMGPDDAYVLVNETGSGIVHQLWLKGPKAGQRGIFYQGLPGTPDNITFNGSDTFWIAQPSLREALDVNADNPYLRRLISLLPISALSAFSGSYSFVVGLDLQGGVVANLQDEAVGFANITSAIQCGQSLYLGSLTMPGIARYPLN